MPKLSFEPVMATGAGILFPEKTKNRLQKNAPCGYAVFAAGQSCSQSCLDTLALRLSLSADLPNIRYMGIIFFLSRFVKRHLV